MTTKELIQKLSELDPSGGMTVACSSVDALWEPIPRIAEADTSGKVVWLKTQGRGNEKNVKLVVL